MTDDPKCLLDLGGDPLIIHYFKALNALAIHEVVLVVGYKKEKIIGHLGNYYKDIKIKYIENNDFLKGSILSLLYAKDEFDDDIITMDGDLLFHKNMLKILVRSEHKNCFLADFDSSDIVDGMKIVIDNQGLVKDVNYGLGIKHQQGDRICESVGIIKWSKKDSHNIRKSFQKLLTQGIDDDVYEKAVKHLIKNNICQFKTVSTKGLPWTFINNPDDLIKAEQMVCSI